LCLSKDQLDHHQLVLFLFVLQRGIHGDLDFCKRDASGVPKFPGGGLVPVLKGFIPVSVPQVALI
jgi:hypothetical protein